MISKAMELKEAKQREKPLRLQKEGHNPWSVGKKKFRLGE